MDIGSVLVDIRANLGQFGADLKEALRELNHATDDMGNDVDDLANRTGDATGRMGGYFKDVSRIVSGIMISQIFYASINAIENATKAIFEFSMTLEDASTKYKMLLGSAEESNKFMAAMQKFASNTPFDFENVDKAAQRIQLMGVKTEAVLPILRTVGNALAVMGGGSETLDRVTVAMRQMYQSPKAQAEELEQFIESGINVSKYLQEQLGLTADQVKNIGDEAISGKTAVQAILQGMSLDPHFANGMEKLSKNTRGMLQNIKDNAKFLSVGLFSNMFEGAKEQIKTVSEYMTKLLAAFQEGGVGGLFQSLFPPETQTVIKGIIGSFQVLWENLKRIFVAIQPIIQAFGGALLAAFAVLIPIISTLTGILASLLEWMLQNKPAVEALTYAIIGLQVAGLVSRLIVGLIVTIRALAVAAVVARAIDILKRSILLLTASMTKNPIVAVIMLLVAAIISLALSSKQAQGWLDGLMRKLAQLAGFDIGKVLMPEKKEDYSKFYKDLDKPLGDVIGSIGETGDAAKKAQKDVKKFLASFDEVFQVPEKDLNNLKDLFPSGDLSNGGKIDLPKIEQPKLPDPPKYDDLLPDFPDFILFPPFKWPKMPKFQWPKLPPFNWPKLPDFQWPRIPVPQWPKMPEWKWPDIPVPQWPPIPVPQWPAMPEWKWPKIPPVSFPPIPVPQWPAMPDWQWPKIPDLQWPEIPVPKWPTMPQWQWPAIPDLQWPEIPVPKWPTMPQWEWPTVQPMTFPPILAPTWPTMAAWVWPNIPQLQWPNLADGFTNAWDGVKGAATTSFNWLSDMWDQHKVGILISVGAIALGIITVLTGGLDLAAAGMITSLGAGIARLGPVLARFGPMVVNVLRGVPSFFTNVFTKIGPLLTPIVTKIGDAFKNLPALITGFIRGIPSSITTLFSKLPAPVQTAVTNIGNTFRNLPTSIGNFIKGIPGNISTLFSKLPTSVQTVVTNVGNAFRNLPTTIGNFIKGIPSNISNLFNKLPQPVQNIANKIADTFKGVPGRIRSLLAGIPNLVSGIFKSAWEGISGFLGKIGDGLSKITGNKVSLGHATGFASGGVIGKDSIVRVGERGRREAIIPLQNGAAMAPFADAVAARLAGSVPQQTTTRGNDQPIMYVGTLIADDRSLRELNRKMQVIQVNETNRGGR